MGCRQAKNHLGRGFTIIELLVVITVIAILAAISIISYGAWRTTTISNQVKSDLTNAASAMESYRTFNNGYPTPSGATVPSCTVTGTPLQKVLTTLTPSTNDCLMLSSDSTATTYCINGYSTDNPSATFYVSSSTQGPQSGTCAPLNSTAAPGAPTGLAITGINGTNITLSWTAVSGATGYNAQCASDPTYIFGMQSANVNAPTVSVTVTGLTASSTYYCHVDATNTNGTSAWASVNSNNSNTNTTNTYGSLAVGTSIDGYWTTAPQGFLLEDGSAVSRTTYADLFSVIGTTYGAGDGSTTFNLPDSRGYAVANQLSSDTNFATLGEKVGAKTVTIPATSLPTIPFGFTYNGGTYSSFPYTGSPNTSGNLAFSVGLTVYGSIGISSTGGGGASNTIQPSIVAMRAIKYAPIDPTATTLPAGTSVSGYWSSIPSGYLPENGAAISRTTYASLFSAIGTTYGAGDGSTTFNVPNSQGRIGVNLSPGDAQFGTMGQQYGEETHTLSLLEVPSHTHTFTYSGGNYASFPYTGSPNTAGGLAFSVGLTLYSAIGLRYNGSDQPFNNLQPTITQQSAIKYTAASGTATPVATGTSISGYWSSVPSGYLAEDGSAVSRATYASLFSAIGTTYGAGDGSTTFNVPNSQGRAEVGYLSGDAQFGTMGQQYGEKTHTLSIAEMPSYAPTFTYGASNYSAFPYTGAPNTSGGLAFSVATTVYNAIGISSAGGGQAFNNIQPSIVKLFAIKT